jgi:hypothetical protein
MPHIETICEILAEVAVQTYDATDKQLPSELNLFIYSLSQDSGVDEDVIASSVIQKIARLRNSRHEVSV